VSTLDWSDQRTGSDQLTGSDQFTWSDTDRRAVDTIRVLAMDAVEAAGNGHPGTAMSLAPAAYLLFQRVVRHDPTEPNWVGRDRFVLSCGHSSLTLYIQLYLSGYGLEIDDLRQYRQWGSLTPGHPEHGHTVGVETTTGPLGQGLGNAVGMAMAARRERGLFDPDRPTGQSPFDQPAKPPDGSQPRRTENSKIRSRPAQLIGKLWKAKKARMRLIPPSTPGKMTPGLDSSKKIPSIPIIIRM